MILGGVAASLSDYRAALGAPGAAAPVCASVIGRFPIAMHSLATLLYVREVQGSYAVAGAISAALLVGTAAGTVVQGRVLDRLGPTRPMLVLVAVYAVAVTGLVVCIEAASPVVVTAAVAVLAGLATPAIEGSSRALWTDLVPSGPRREAAYTYEAISLETFFVLGPALAAVLVVATPWPGTALVVAASAELVGTTWFALTRSVRRRSERIRAERATGALARETGLLGVFRRPGLRTVALASLGFGLVAGTAEVGVFAAAEFAGSPAAGGILLSAWSVVSVLAGVAYGMRPWPRPLHLRLPVLLAGFALLVTVMGLVSPLGSLVLLAVPMMAAGALITPQVTGHSLGVELTAPAELATEAFNWMVMAAVLGVSAGQALAGTMIDLLGPAGYATGGAVGMLVALLLWLRRGSVAAAGDRREPAGSPA
ncbi:ABC transporter, permease protein [Pseudonocardia sp. Ae168_Ps1]|nr:ABC transporter, permease protein [Pseudonocardia sp. Ae150A_Ps1]OLL80842.1 ABC transporter, permease protein [Pseudonocardia sp. Ae168_Ps1]OLL85040.1 ABC transporter, permease protein [Pseudonocardia sp. Ae263_Ps1]OLL94943.1 ABC transporter, permease protein [Pseudonocardia sp. Ae356_Ps1]